jgi:plastocyanin
MPHHRRHRTLAAALSLTLVGLVLAIGCGSASGGPKQTGAPIATTTSTIGPVQSGDVAVAAIDNNFKAENITVTAGSKVTWTNSGRNDHNVKPVDGGDFGVDTAGFKPGATYTATFATPGTYHYFCSIHGTTARGMVGTVQVVAS